MPPAHTKLRRRVRKGSFWHMAVLSHYAGPDVATSTGTDFSFEPPNGNLSVQLQFNRWSQEFATAAFCLPPTTWWSQDPQCHRCDQHSWRARLAYRSRVTPGATTPACWRPQPSGASYPSGGQRSVKSLETKARIPKAGKPRFKKLRIPPPPQDHSWILAMAKIATRP